MQTSFDIRNIALASVIPLGVWTLIIMVITLSGYPGVVCMTPVGWLLALSVGIRVSHSSESPGMIPVLEAAIGGALLGLWQGLLFATTMAASPYLPDSSFTEDLPSPYLIGLVVSCIGIPVTAALAALISWIVVKKSV